MDIKLRPQENGNMVDQEYIKNLFDYSDGKLFWKLKKSDKIKIGQEAGTLRKNNYKDIRIDGKNYRTHRLIYLYHYGFIPEYLDHVDGNTLNNKIENLRPATVKQNSYNRTKQVNNTSGYKGVYLHKATKKWVAYCDGNSLGYYNTPEDANIVVKNFRNNKHKEYARN